MRRRITGLAAAVLMLAAVLTAFGGCSLVPPAVRYTVYIGENGAAGVPVTDDGWRKQFDAAFASDTPAQVPDGAAGFQVTAQGGREGDRTFRLWLSPAKGSAYYSGSLGSFEIPQTQALFFLSMELFSSAWTKPLLTGAVVTIGEEQAELPLLDYSLQIEAPMGPYIKEQSVKSAQKHVPELSSLDGLTLQLPGVPVDVGTEYLDESGGKADPDTDSGPLTLRVTARYDVQEGVSGTVRYALRVNYNPPMSAVLSSASIGQGGLFAVRLLHVRDGAEVTLQASHLKEPSPVFVTENGLIALVAVAAGAEPGDYAVTISASLPDGGGENLSLPYTVEKSLFVRQDLTVTSEQQASYNNDAIRRENELVAAAKSKSEALPLWSGPFLQPVEGRISTEYAQERYINGSFSNRHSGIDIAAAKGSPVSATAAGRVAFAGELPISGYTVILDHGLWLFSSYCHLSELSVREGDEVAQGETVGLVGSTGFSTGPHLHWSVSLRGTYVNPAGLMEADPLREE